ncbi:unnamed protein product [Pedinophyceae sp. YPF-701]|nr:unnamed protein product [Pedinophyceae sp. YPF-701]
MAGRWEPLSAHPTANFAVQAAIATARTPQQVEGMAAELCDHFPALMRGSRAGVVAALVAGSQRHAAACKQVAKALSSATMELGRLSSSSEMVPWMLFMGHKVRHAHAAPCRVFQHVRRWRAWRLIAVALARAAGTSCVGRGDARGDAQGRAPQGEEEKEGQ